MPDAGSPAASCLVRSGVKTDARNVDCGVGVKTTQFKPALDTGVFVERFQVEPGGGRFQPPDSLHQPTAEVRTTLSATLALPRCKEAQVDTVETDGFESDVLSSS